MNNCRIFVILLRNLSLSIMNKLVVIRVCIVLALASCNSNDEPKNIPRVELETYLFYKELFNLPIDSIPFEIPTLIKKYSPFFELFGSNVIHIGFPEEKRFGILLQQFVADYHMQNVYSDLIKEFSEIKAIEDELNNGFSYFNYYFPNRYIPKIYYYHGGFNQSVITTDSLIGIGLDKYLGNSYPYYLRLGLPEYQRIKMRKEFIPIDAMRFYLYGIFPFNEEKENVLSHLIYEGKIQYLLDKCFPNLDDTLKFGYSKNQLIWCEKNERTIWQYLIDKKMLFSNDIMDIKRYTNDGPFTTTFPRQSPARAAVWLGYRIVHQYIKNNPALTMEELMAEKDAQKITQHSEYNP